jgi:hypothetical protein
MKGSRKKTQSRHTRERERERAPKKQQRATYHSVHKYTHSYLEHTVRGGVRDHHARQVLGVSRRLSTTRSAWARERERERREEKKGWEKREERREEVEKKSDLLAQVRQIHVAIDTALDLHDLEA